MNVFKLGSLVSFEHSLTKIEGNWIPSAHPEKQGIIIGKRIIKDIRFDYYGGWDDPAYKETILINPRAAYLVAFNLHRKPVYVLPHHLTLK